MRFPLPILLASALAAASQVDDRLPPWCSLATNVGGATCEAFAHYNHLSLDLFEELNPDVECPDLEEGRFYCIDDLYEPEPEPDNDDDDDDEDSLSTSMTDFATATKPPTPAEFTTIITGHPTANISISTPTANLTSRPATTARGPTAVTTMTPPAAASSTQTTPNSAPNPEALVQAAAMYGWLTMSAFTSYHLCRRIML
ncbi:hypothetical protein H112_00932 [Trichophyton rubrum D6]|uniref:LysM domain-containing protein n=2 Tax=Trichophyton rubrum TaxID=5551 RepID=A0A178F403_TRIRU|nr:hypothetical protein H100_00930 [Trichophyton rubrum MR850]EZF46064.1 hypothetical protein H102_00922 [Trichophyton rubrum CBS 100081]EZF56710.1 hypothetical protein H103_00930 [Trichophyton rubrum CBS 288.86]EZF67321.1 hypothetical protein H104_00914 [Trichophyton rubrum CBS 289.86]EZF88622.1 hypothetical protein H110_00931 [Trichophyton rubrum MR1448]EZG21016.1 hypothetical protein H107_00980 [Trichophyton rubrum CBS 202.88]KDB37831.1 hypothetical protein H112_00932 [Trichophyton rubrum 